MIKLIIWDLDGVFWENALSEVGNTGNINQQAIDFIIETEKYGIVHSICSKNKKELVLAELKKLQIEHLFVFSVIEYVPKGNSVKQIIENCNIRECDVLFVDDNIINQKEVKFYCPDINIEPDTNFIKNFTYVRSKRKTSQYKILETKHRDKDNKNFLKDSDINIAIFEENNCILFYDRIHELVNRANQLNYTNTKFTDTSDSEWPFYEIDNRKNYVVFSWDRYGYYGLVGYYSSQRDTYDVIDRFVFSCRILNMGIENWAAQLLHKEKFILPNNLPLNNKDYSYIKVHKYDDVRDFIEKQEGLLPSVEKKIGKIYAGCMSYSFWALTTIYNHITHSDHFNFDSVTQLTAQELQEDPELLIISVLHELDPRKYSSTHLNDIKITVDSFFDRCQSLNKKILLIMPYNFDDVSWTHQPYTKEEILSVYEFWGNRNCDVIYTFPKNQFIHLNRSQQHNVSAQISEWVKKFLP